MTPYDGSNLEWEDRHVQSPQAVIGRVSYQPGGSCGPRIQRDYELVILHSGSCELHLDKVVHQLTIGYVYLMLPQHHEHYLFSPRAQTHHSWCTYNPQSIPSDLASLLQQARFKAPCSETMDQLLSAAFHIDFTTGLHAAEAINALALTLFHEYLRICDTLLLGTDKDVSVTKSIQYMEQHFGEKDCLQHCHIEAGVSRNTLIKRFKEALHMTPDRYLWRLRTEKGIAMLMNTGLTVAEIAYRCGFQNPFHFSRKVSELQKRSPREIRKRAWHM